METAETSQDQLIDFLYNNGHSNVDDKGDAGLCSIKQVGGIYAILTNIDHYSHKDIYTYPDKSMAVRALEKWSGKTGTRPKGYVACHESK